MWHSNHEHRQILSKDGLSVPHQHTCLPKEQQQQDRIEKVFGTIHLITSLYQFSLINNSFHFRIIYFETTFFLLRSADSILIVGEKPRSGKVAGHLISPEECQMNTNLVTNIHCNLSKSDLLMCYEWCLYDKDLTNERQSEGNSEPAVIVGNNNIYSTRITMGMFHPTRHLDKRNSEGQAEGNVPEDLLECAIG